MPTIVFVDFEMGMIDEASNPANCFVPGFGQPIGDIKPLKPEILFGIKLLFFAAFAAEGAMPDRRGRVYRARP